MSQVKENDTVKLNYTGKLADGQVFDTSVGKQPLEIKLGEGKLIPGFEKALHNMKVSEKKTFEIPSAEAYGAVREDLIQEVAKSQLPPEIKPEVGMGLTSKTPDGRELPLVVKEVKDEAIVVDANHPLAGKDLTFEVELLEIK